MTRSTRVLTLLPALVFCLGMPRGAAAQRCEHEAQRTATAATSGVERVRIIARAGDLEVTGRAAVSQISARGRACTSDADDLGDLALRVRRDGGTLVLEATQPDHDMHFGNYYAYMDVVVELPQGMPVTIEDGSGNMIVAGVGAARVNDGSGNIRVSDVRGAIVINDGSGEIELSAVGGNADIDDGSGNIEITDVRGDVLIEDGSGNVTARQVTGSVRVDDGSGDIRLADVTRNVEVDDGSGSIRVERVGGDLTVDEAGSGDVSYDDVDGRVSIGD